jgi:hypothetical protein
MPGACRPTASRSSETARLAGARCGDGCVGRSVDAQRENKSAVRCTRERGDYSREEERGSLVHSDRRQERKRDRKREGGMEGEGRKARERGTPGELRLSPSVVRSTPSAIILRSDGGLRTIGRSPMSRYRSSASVPAPELPWPAPRPWPPAPSPAGWPICASDMVGDPPPGLRTALLPGNEGNMSSDIALKPFAAPAPFFPPPPTPYMSPA